ncbi:MAG TPA: hypothetical protein VGA13_09000 [Acidimicrobiales bacterium]
MTTSNDIRHRFEVLAERGHRRGAPALLDALEASLAERPLVNGARLHRHKMARLAIAATSIAVVAGTILVLRPDGSGDVDREGVLVTGAASDTTTSPSTTEASPTSEEPTAASTPVVPSSTPTTEGFPTTTSSPAVPAGPPPATISGANGAVEMEQGSTCWDGLCADTIGPGEQTPSFSVDGGETLTVTWDSADSPSRVDLSIEPVEGGPRIERDLDTSNPTTFVADLGPGSYYVIVFSVWGERDRDDTSNFVRLDVR